MTEEELKAETLKFLSEETPSDETVIKIQILKELLSEKTPYSE